MIMSDSHSDSPQSGDPDKYYWIKGDYPYGYPENWAGDEGGPQHAAPSSPPSPDAVSSNRDPILPDLNDRMEPMQEHIFQLEGFLQDRDRELQDKDATIDDLVERIASLSIYIVSLWSRLFDSERKRKVVTVALVLALAVICVCVGVIIVCFPSAP